MVSNARLDLPEPDRPVITVRLSRGSSTDTFFRLCTRAPCTATVVRGAGLAAGGAGFALPAIGVLRGMEERQFLHLDIALPGQPGRQMRLADQPAVGQILARAGHAFNAVVPVEVVFDL